jgi:hypothetical protein
MSRSQVRWSLVVAGVLLWLVAVLPAYYVVHKPLVAAPASAVPTISPSFSNVASTIMSEIADLSLLILTVIVAAGWGSRLGRRLGLDFDSGLERWTLSAMLGLGALGTLVFGLAVAGGLVRWIAYALLLVLGLAAVSEIGKLLGWLATGFRRLRPTGVPWLWLYTALICLLTLGAALLPPTAWDALVYHLQGPRLYVESHRLLGVPENLYLNWPGQVEMLFTWGLLLKGDTLAKLFHWVFWPLIAALLYALARRAIGARAGQWAIAFWASVPFAAELAGVAYVDLGLAAFVLAGIYAFLRWTESHSSSWLSLSGLFIGLAMATKYTAATWLALLILLFAYHALKHGARSFGWIVTHALGLAIVAVLPLVPWLAKNWLVTGNPVYPFLFGGTEWNSTRQAFLVGSGGGYSRNLLDYVALPWLATVVGTTGTAAFDATTGPLLLCLVPLVVLFRERPRPVNYGLALAVGQLAIFAVTIYGQVYLVEARLLLPVFPFLCLAATFVLVRMPDWDRKALHISWVVGWVVVLVLAVNLVTEAGSFLASQPLAPLLGLESREGYLQRRLGAYFEVMRYANERLPPDSKIFYLWEPRSYYGLQSSWADATLDNLAQLRLAHSDVTAALGELRANGFTHLLLYRSGLEFLLQPTPRPPTLGTLIAQSPAEGSYYPLADTDLEFLDALLARCHRWGGVGQVYEFYRLP